MEIDPYDDERFVELIDESEAFLNERNKEIGELYGVSEYSRFYTRQCDAVMFFFDDHDEPRIGFKCETAGSYSPVSGTWLWAWVSNTVLDEKKQASLNALELGKEKDFIALTTPKWKCTIEEAWVMASITAKLVDAMGVYRIPIHFRDVKKELEIIGVKVTKEMEEKVYLYTFELLMDVLDGSQININCVWGEGKCPGMIMADGECSNRITRS